MARPRQLGWILIALIFATLGGSPPLESQTTTTITNPTTTCVDSIRKYYFPSGPTNPTLIAIIKFLTMSDSCSVTMMNAANCVTMPSDLAATASGSEISMSPSCQWDCTACGTIATGPGDGLPVELMDFSIEDETASLELESGDGAAADGRG